jgi:hypothetical protein
METEAVDMKPYMTAAASAEDLRCFIAFSKRMRRFQAMKDFWANEFTNVWHKTMNREIEVVHH